LKLIDFGLAIDEEENYNIMGSPNYMSPEIMNEGKYSFESDMWSLGIILHFCATSKLPFENSNKYDLYDSIKKENSENNGELLLPALNNNKHVSKELKDLIKKMIVFKPSNRIRIVDAFEHEFLKQFEQPEEKSTNNILEVLKSIFKFSEMNIFQKNVYFYLAKICKTEEENKEEKSLFDVFDSSFKGYIVYLDFEKVVNKYKPNINEVMLKQIWKGLDYNNSRSIQYSDFLAATLNFLQFMTVDKFKSGFNYFARDNTFINMDSFVETLMTTNLKVNEEDIVRFFNSVEKGTIYYEDFKRLIQSN